MYTARGTLDRSAAVERYAPMVRRLASQLIARLPANVEIDDLIQAGMIGLMDALSRYETGHGAQF
jgi:RNA polymerase sigma factor for flagellar operon FliA